MEHAQAYTRTQPQRRRIGFTLIELIIVIAILAILAGVGIPVYSAYTKRANEASDRQMIGTVNTAFAAACLENGFDNRSVTAAELVFDESGRYILGVEGVTHPTMSTDGVAASFEKFWGENVGKPLKYFTKDDISFNPDEPYAGMFTTNKEEGGLPEGVSVLSYDGKEVYYTAEQVIAYKESNFNFGAIATRTWTRTMDSLVGAVGANTTTVTSLKNDSAFRAYLAGLGKTPDELDGVQTGQYLVRFVASKLSGLNVDQVFAAIDPADGVGSMQAVTALISGKPYGSSQFAEKAAGAALVYGLTGAYANSEYVMDDEFASNYSFTTASVSSLGTFTDYITHIDPDAYEGYLEELGKDDLAGFLSVMQLVSGNDGVVDEYLNGEHVNFSSDKIVGMINALLNEVD